MNKRVELAVRSITLSLTVDRLQNFLPGEILALWLREIVFPARRLPLHGTADLHEATSSCEWYQTGDLRSLWYTVFSAEINHLNTPESHLRCTCHFSFVLLPTLTCCALRSQLFLFVILTVPQQHTTSIFNQVTHYATL